MASSKATFALLVLAMLLVSQVQASSLVTGSKAVDVQKNKGGRIQPQSCTNLCNYRCSQTQYHKPCIKYCNLCCQKCLCVPPGFYGNKQVCPCYNNMKNARGGPKCP
ncbi:hypothetical protein SELMODRAFT_419248 [Selaginella moellendorffii]|uniref:Gibberellin regulated protein n=1 Tax=Selaginella moellendorffii TaxID=88036 RepID=D8S8B4_SELML|nr:gibberellin-regulated protein 4 [Selaginella moellendorffii]EFJ19500.1 hypothetical protein SELMODRAFT_419248 [Selaginella moellendorffii]|eukprot:XP_002979611.1 gibberellin-regulated protein 4 [Selaginella moellendorffii]